MICLTALDPVHAGRHPSWMRAPRSAAPAGGGVVTAPYPPAFLDLLEEVRAEAYAAGQLDALRGFAREHARLELLGPNWREQGIADHLALVQARRDAALERYEERRVADNVAAGRHPGYRYRGGAVDWLTGLPEGSACAWLRSKQLREAEQVATVTTLPARSDRTQDRQVAA
jgi:hypothetical protein